MAKKLKTNSIDRLSNFPDSVLHHLLSFLPTKHVVQTCLLSKRWKQIWCSIPYLDLQQCSFSSPGSFKIFVDSLLHLRDSSNILVLKLSCTYFPHDPSRINTWLIASIRRKLQVLDLDIKSSKPFYLTPLVFNCPSLRVLKLGRNLKNMNLPTSVDLPLLKFLQFSNVIFHDLLTTGALFSTCPSLQNLVVASCESKNDYMSLKTFYQFMNLAVTRSRPLQINFSTQNLSFKLNVTESKDQQIDLTKIINKYHTLADYLESLTLQHSFFQSWDVVILPIMQDIQIAFNNLKRLNLATSFNDRDIVIINNLLKYSPNIQALALEGFTKKGLYATITTSTSQSEGNKMWFDCKLPHLKSVQIQNFRGCANEVNFIKFLLTNATVLEKLVICCLKDQSSKEKTEMMKISEKLLAHPRASSTVGILFM